MKALISLLAVSSASWNAAAFAPARTMVQVTMSPIHASLPKLPLVKTSPILRMTAAAAMEEPSEGKAAKSGGEGTMSALRFNLVKSIVGAGVLSLPAGKKLFVDTNHVIKVCMFYTNNILPSILQELQLLEAHPLL